MLVERLERFFQRREEARRRDYFYVTEVAKCPRQIFYAVKGFPRPPLDGQTARRMALGDDVHRRIVNALYSLGLAVAAEVPIPENGLFHGRADAIISLGGENFVVEIKSVHPYQFDQAVAGPRRDHYLQLQLYLHYFDLQRGILLMENKANQELKEFLVERDEKVIRETLDRFRNLHRLIFGEGRLPPIPDKSDWEYDQCRYCPFREFCLRDVTEPPQDTLEERDTVPSEGAPEETPLEEEGSGKERPAPRDPPPEDGGMEEILLFDF